MKYTDNQYNLKVVDHKSQDGFSGAGDVTSGCLVFICDAGTKTLATIYSDAARAAKTNPISRAQFATDGKIVFYGASSSYDITVAHSDGSVSKLSGVTPNDHTITMNRDGVDKCLVFPMVFNAGGTETDTGLDLPVGVIVHEVRVEVVTVDATETVDVGLLSSETSGDADGFVAAVSVATAGFPALAVFTTGANETYLSAVKYGALMGSSVVGADVVGDAGNVVRLGHVVTGSNAVSVTYTPSTSDTFVGYGYVYFRHLR